MIDLLRPAPGGDGSAHPPATTPKGAESARGPFLFSRFSFPFPGTQPLCPGDFRALTEPGGPRATQSLQHACSRIFLCCVHVACASS